MVEGFSPEELEERADKVDGKGWTEKIWGKDMGNQKDGLISISGS